jgi:hypothetical protein
MSEPSSNSALNEPAPGWVPLACAVFSHPGPSCFEFDFPWTNAPASIELDVDALVFQLKFKDGRLVQGSPWDLMESPVFQSGLPSLVAYKAIWTVWDVMCESFARAVDRSHYKLFARLNDVNAGFEPIAQDHWRLYRVTSWLTGEATAPDGRKAWSIQALSKSISKSPAGRKPKYDRDQVVGEVRRLYREFGGPYGLDKEPGWQTRTDLENRIADFLSTTTGDVPAKSTLQDLAKAAIEAIKDE